MIAPSLTRRPLIAAAVLGLAFATSLPAQKATFDPNTAIKGELGLPSPIDKAIALQVHYAQPPVVWNQVLSSVSAEADVKGLKDKNDVCLALGVRVADGVLAIMAQNDGKLNSISDQIEALARKLDVPDEKMERARTARAEANRGHWAAVFFQLGALQVDIIHDLSMENRKTQRPLIMVAGWLRGLEYAAHVINERYSKEASNILREPMLIEAMEKELAGLPADLKANPKVAKIIDSLPKLRAIVNIGLDGSITPEDVKKIEALTHEINVANLK